MIAHIAGITFRCREEHWSLAHNNFGGLHTRGFVGERVASSEVARFRLMGAAPVDTAQEVAQFGLTGEVRGREMRAAQNTEIMLTITATAATFQTEPMVTRFALTPAVWVCASVDMICSCLIGD